MTFYLIRIFAFGLAWSAVVGVALTGLAHLASLPYVPDPLAWPFLLFLLVGSPLVATLELLPGFEELQWAAFPSGGASGVFGTLFLGSLITFSAVLALSRHLWLRKSRAAPNNSRKPNPVRPST